ncbi:MAG TPA: hypothetical protein VFQ61_13855 [Polyangiaceae bacterium]|nr:hypothetical protein [Polyangiaceae bacterium]
MIACAKVEPPGDLRSRFTIEVRVHSGPEPVAGAQLWRGGEHVATSSESGIARVSLTGEEGERAEIAIHCPAGYGSSTSKLSWTLHALSDAALIPRFDAACTRVERRVVVGLRASNAGELPIRYLNQTVAKTDSSGVAHLELSVLAGQPVTLTLDTTRDASLLPRNPELTFVASDRSELVLIEQKFSRLVPPAKPLKPAPRVPQRL